MCCGNTRSHCKAASANNWVEVYSSTHQEDLRLESSEIAGVVRSTCSLHALGKGALSKEIG